MTKFMTALLALALLCASSPGRAASPSALAAEDRQQILDLISAYSYRYDAKEVEQVVALFVSDCVFEMYSGGGQTPVAKVNGQAELRALVTQRLAMLQQKGIRSRHYQTNTILSTRADGQVEGTTMLNLAWQVPGEKPLTVMTGVYNDLFVKTGGVWKFAKRSASIDQTDLAK